MGARAGGTDRQAYVVRQAATTASPVSHGQPRGTYHCELRRVVVRTWRDAPVHTAQRLVAEHDRIHSAHSGPPRAGRSDAGKSARTHPLAGSYGSDLDTPTPRLW